MPLTLFVVLVFICVFTLFSRVSLLDDCVSTVFFLGLLMVLAMQMIGWMSLLLHPPSLAQMGFRPKKLKETVCGSKMGCPLPQLRFDLLLTTAPPGTPFAFQTGCRSNLVCGSWWRDVKQLLC